jgi:anti-sigma factor ChrR (cupin superfamily)
MSASPQDAPKPSTAEHAAEQAALYAAGALTNTEAEQFERRVRAGEAMYVAAAREYAPAAEVMLFSAGSETPPPHVRQAVMSRIRSSQSGSGRQGEHAESDATSAAAVTASAGNTSDVVVIRGSVGFMWVPSGVPGVDICDLYLDKKANRRTVLIRMQPNTVYPDHDHDDAEECIVLEGELEIAGTVLRRNDYIRTPPGGHHGVPRSRTGCVLLITCQLDKVA